MRLDNLPPRWSRRFAFVGPSSRSFGLIARWGDRSPHSVAFAPPAVQASRVLRTACLGVVASLWLTALPVRAQPDAPDPEAGDAAAPAPGSASDSGSDTTDAKADDTAGDEKRDRDDEDDEDEDEDEDDEDEDEDEDDDDMEDPRVLEQRRAEKEQTAHEEKHPREPLVAVEPPDTPEWERRLEVGASFAFVLRPWANALAPSDIGYNPAPGFGVHLQWPVFEWLRFHPYFVHAFHSLDIPQGGLTTTTANSISADATISDESVATFIIGAKIAPTWPITKRWRAWATAGVGWGRYEFPKMTVTETDGTTFEIRERAAVVVEFPLGLGVAFDVIERWMSVHYEATAAPITGHSGNGHEVFQAIDADGNIRDVGGFGAVDVSIVQNLGVSIIL